MAKRRVYHVTWNKAENGWATTLEGFYTPVRVSRTKLAAKRFARKLAKSRRWIGQVIVHKKNGRIETEWTFGADPVRSKG